MERGIQVVNIKIPKILLMTLWVFLPSVSSYVTENHDLLDLDHMTGLTIAKYPIFRLSYKFKFTSQSVLHIVAESKQSVWHCTLQNSPYYFHEQSHHLNPVPLAAIYAPAMTLPITSTVFDRRCFGSCTIYFLLHTFLFTFSLCSDQS